MHSLIKLVSIARKLNKSANTVALLEKRILGAGLSSRHSAIIRSANAAPMAARMAQLATQHWKNMNPLWGVEIPFEQPGALWIAPEAGQKNDNQWRQLEHSLQQEGIEFHSLTHTEAAELGQHAIKINQDEIYFHEPEALQLDPADILNALQNAATLNGIEVMEHTQVTGFDVDSNGRISAVHSNHGSITCDYVINAAGAWSPKLFAPLNIPIPISLEPVYVANFLVGTRDIPTSLPIIADFVHHAYFRRWRGSILHLHQPRARSSEAIAQAFSRGLMNPAGANIIYDPSNYVLNFDQLEAYLGKVKNRFIKARTPLYAGGYVSFFDITPDLRFILGKDSKIENLVHVLGAGQALKYAPIFGEIISDIILKGQVQHSQIDISEFSIGRFSDQAFDQFWSAHKRAENSL
ncbi:FAD dependent oxidoreductase [Nitrosococcus halophilus Nc 4]|uniref:FAD dependent oxidoreductase n=1 Tax=Nitrosococcus halophilus (strain Nc4) TaxID=472759 RepID=D5C1X3_NITHN|nr:FAD dependent oxidoreductase [Nitrosococcus halophilus Nc 4]